MVAKPLARPKIPPRMSENLKRRLTALPSCEEIALLLETAKYKGHPKHKRNPTRSYLSPTEVSEAMKRSVMNMQASREVIFC